MSKQVHVAVGAVIGPDRQVLIARRPEAVHQGGLWEFPGGKVEPGESPVQALTRELWEEVGVRVGAAEPLIQIHHDYGDKRVFLDVYRVTVFNGEVEGREGQPVQWVGLDNLNDYEFPAANRAIIHALQLPDELLITGAAPDTDALLARLQQILLEHKPRLIQLRVPGIDDQALLLLAHDAWIFCQAAGTGLQVNAPAHLYPHLPRGCGLHLNRWQLAACESRPIPSDALLGASCHNAQEIARAQAIGVDYLCLSPVATTWSHPGQPPIGWNTFARLVADAKVPVYALGGMQREDIATARANGGQGIAGIGYFWQ
ncbi:Nudix family hydrolase [Marinimicrobium alkaliphilum]|uniref:Nudix family hydrolase n=1 Tax=Marinimicrobium alkaliphilum TaxID=2202654 RepID=UPI0018E0B2B4|nr:Nudix family hydrolase [Marinimicrobium alkaliphilum]